MVTKWFLLDHEISGQWRKTILTNFSFNFFLLALISPEILSEPTFIFPESSAMKRSLFMRWICLLLEAKLRDDPLSWENTQKQMKCEYFVPFQWSQKKPKQQNKTKRKKIRYFLGNS